MVFFLLPLPFLQRLKNGRFDISGGDKLMTQSDAIEWPIGGMLSVYITFSDQLGLLGTLIEQELKYLVPGATT